VKGLQACELSASTMGIQHNGQYHRPNQRQAQLAEVQEVLSLESQKEVEITPMIEHAGT
jgi:hypothetical protein